MREMGEIMNSDRPKGILKSSWVGRTTIETESTLMVSKRTNGHWLKFPAEREPGFLPDLTLTFLVSVAVEILGSGIVAN